MGVEATTSTNDSQPPISGVNCVNFAQNKHPNKQSKEKRGFDNKFRTAGKQKHRKQMTTGKQMIVPPPRVAVWLSLRRMSGADTARGTASSPSTTLVAENCGRILPTCAARRRSTAVRLRRHAFPDHCRVYCVLPGVAKFGMAQVRPFRFKPHGVEGGGSDVERGKGHIGAIASSWMVKVSV